MKKQFEEYLYSPYTMEGIAERAFITKTDETLTVDTKNDKYYTIKEVPKNKRVMHDELVYTKLFVSSVKPLMSLPHTSLKILLYAMSTVKPLSQIVFITEEDVCLTCGFSKSTFLIGLYELLERKILCKKLGSSIEFWFDPNIFFNGNRLRVYKRHNDSSLNLLDEL